MNPQSLYAFYGSLRRGMANYPPFASGLLFQSTEVLPGFQLFAMEDYPYAIKSHDPSHLLTVEVFQVVDPELKGLFMHWN